MKKLIVFFVLILLNCSLTFSQIGINNDGSTPDASAMLDVKSTLKGVLVPRMTIAQRDGISNPAKGLMVYCTDKNQFYYNMGTPESPFWLVLNTQWVANGSDITYNGGSVGIGTNQSPAAKLDVYGNIAINGTPVINSLGQWVGSATGIQGPQGPQGPQGMQGIQGVAGANGKTVLNGSVDPATSIGTDGDFYINTGTHKIFGPKSGSMWGNGTILVGPQGIQGLTGPAGLQGPTGPQGPAGPAVSTYSVCADPTYTSSSNYYINVCYMASCNCGSATLLSSLEGPCTVTSNTGSCSATSILDSYSRRCPGACCVCKPK